MMGYGHDTIALVIYTLGQFFAYVVLLRFLLQMAGADFYNPISQAVAKLTNAAVAPFRMLAPPIAGRDFSALLLGYLVYVVMFAVLMLIGGGLHVVSLLLMALVATLNSVLNIYFYAVIGSVIISWVAPNSYHPAPQLIQQLTEPVFKLARKVIPPISGIDLSPILIFLVIQIIQMQLSRLL